VITDHANLQHYMAAAHKLKNSHQVRWLESLAPFDFTIYHRAGKKNPADGPFRCPDYAVNDKSIWKVPTNYGLPTIVTKHAYHVWFPENLNLNQTSATSHSGEVGVVPAALSQEGEASVALQTRPGANNKDLSSLSKGAP
ncbi:hypothetical protein KEM55_000453, partial [Ascosphaera atra]